MKEPIKWYERLLMIAFLCFLIPVLWAMMVVGFLWQFIKFWEE